MANYYDNEILPVPIDAPKPISIIPITFSGTKPTIKVGGSAKLFTAQLPEENNFDIMWSISDEANTYGDSYDNYTQTFGDYTVTTTDRTLSIKITRNYNLVGKIITITALCADGSEGRIDVEVIS